MKTQEISYTITDRADAVEEEITNTLSTPPNTNGPVRKWTTTRYLGLYNWTIHLNFETGGVKSKYTISSLFKYSAILLALVLLWEIWHGYTVFSLLALGIGFYVLSMILHGPMTNLEINNLRVTQKSNTRFATLLLLLSIMSIWIAAYSSSLLPSVLVHIVFLIALGHWAVLPFLENTKEDAVGRWILGILPLGFGFVFLAVLQTYVISFMIQNTNGLQSVGIWTGIIFGVVILALMFWSCSKFLEYVHDNRRIPHINSLTLRFGFLLLFVVLNTLTLLGVIVSVEILIWGVTGSMLFVEPSNQTIFLTSNFYSHLDAFFAGSPLLPNRTYSVGFLILLNAPIVVMVASWVSHFYSNLHSKLKLLTRSTTDRTLSRLSETSVRILDTEALSIYPTVLFFGWKQYIVVSQKVVTELDEKELAAVFAHEQYHLKNRDYLVNTLASLLSLFVGGRNSLLLFYNYGQIEKDADRYAADMVGEEALISALDRLELVQLRERKHTSGLTIGSPGFIKSLSFRNGFSKELVIDMWFEVKSYLTAPYHLFFGRFVFDTAHSSIEERKSWIRDD